jgi:cytochrome d ubiquinol oxidase subunit I
MDHTDLVDLSRLQFAVTALYHFLFVPLTIGLSMILGILETVYVMTGKEVWKQATKFWAKLFAINFAMGVATGITMEFQFGTNWAYYAHFVGDIFGLPLALEGMMAFFLESTFVGIMFFGWDKVSKIKHLIVTWMTALGANLSALWILIANGWMQHPVGARFNPDTMRMELESIKEVIFNEVAQAKFVHTVSAGYVMGSIFVLAISSYYLLRKRHIDIALRSIAVAASFGLASALSVTVLGDESGYLDTLNQKAKLAAMESVWETVPAPAPITLFGIPDPKEQKTLYAIRIPYVLGIIATRSFDTEIMGIKEIVEESKAHIRNGLIAYDALEKVRTDIYHNDPRYRQLLDEHFNDIGYAFLLTRFNPNPLSATEEEIQKTAEYTIPNVPVIFFSFRIMVFCAFYFIALFVMAFYFVHSKKIAYKKWFLRMCLYSLPLPWIAAEVGWIVAEYGRQPWMVEGILPTYMGVSSTTPHEVLGSLIAFIVFYSTLLVIDIFLMVKYVKLGPQKISNTY